MKLTFLAGMALSLLTWCATSGGTSAASLTLPTPEGLQPCSPADPVAITEARVATKIGAEFLSCFQSIRVGTAPIDAVAKQPVEYAFALALPGQSYTGSDLAALLSKVKEQWRGFDPLSTEYKEAYVARLNALERDARSPNMPVTVSVKPVLVEIDKPNKNYYVVTSIRSYVLQADSRQISMIKVNSDAIVLLGSRLIRLTVQRTFSNRADIAQVQSQIDNWARVIARS